MGKAYPGNGAANEIVLFSGLTLDMKCKNRYNKLDINSNADTILLKEAYAA